MVVVNRVKEDFYQLVCDEHVLLLCALDVDALCACKILQAMFKADHVVHTVIPVAGKSDVKRAYSDHADQSVAVVMINCGGCVNLLEFLEPADTGVRFYIIDSRRPLELDNIYDQEQVVIVLREGREVVRDGETFREGENLDAPEFEEIYSAEMQDDDDDDDGYDDYYEEEEEGGATGKRKRRGEDSYESRRKKHLWHRRRDQLMHKYYELDYHGTAASLVCYELACKLNRDNNDLVWLAITGLTEQYLYEKINNDSYVTNREQLQSNVLRHNRSDDDAPPSSINSMRITFVNELKLVLYRHWTFYESLSHSECIVNKFRTWLVEGREKLSDLLADMGLPLVQCRKKYSSMDSEYREENLKQLVNGSAHKFKLDKDINFGSFVAQCGYRYKFCAADMVYACTALLEDAEKPSSECFLNALEALSKSNLKMISEGIELAKQQQIAIVEEVMKFRENPTASCGPFLHVAIQEGTPHVKFFSRPLTLLKLGRFLRDCWVAMMTKMKRARTIPVIVSSPIEEGNLLVAGVLPQSDDGRKSEFKRAFQHAADNIQAHASFDRFNSSVVEIKAEERTKFFDSLLKVSHF